MVNWSEGEKNAKQSITYAQKRAKEWQQATPKPTDNNGNARYSVLHLVTHEDIVELTAAISRLADLLDGTYQDIQEERARLDK